MTKQKSTKIIYPDGKVLILNWPLGKRPDIDWLRRAVGGCIESVDRFIPNGGPYGRIQAYANDESRILELECNIPGMKEVNWPEPVQGWGAIPKTYPMTPGSIIFISGNMSEEEEKEQRKRMERWSPICGPVVILYGWNDEEYDDEEGYDPGTLGNEINDMINEN